MPYQLTRVFCYVVSQHFFSALSGIGLVYVVIGEFVSATQDSAALVCT